MNYTEIRGEKNRKIHYNKTFSIGNGVHVFNLFSKEYSFNHSNSKITINREVYRVALDF